MAKQPDLTIIVVTWNRPELIRTCLQHIRRAIAESGLDCEVWVVDNGSTAGDADVVATEFPEVKLLRNEANLGFARANNLALKRSAGRYCLLVNNDVRLSRSVIVRCVEYLESHPDVGIVGPRLILPGGHPQQSWGRFLTPSRAILEALHVGWLRARLSARQKSASQIAAPLEVDWVTGACFLIRREVVEQVGLLDPQYFFYSEEMDWCLRARRAGWKVYYLPDVEARHDHAATARENVRWYARMLRESRTLFLRKHYGRWAAFLYRVATLVGSIPLIVRWQLSLRTEAGIRREEAREVLAWALSPGPPETKSSDPDAEKGGGTP